MFQWLPRGTTVLNQIRVKRMLSAGNDWQIYSTSQDSYALAVTPSLYTEWLSTYLLPSGIFAQTDDGCYWVFVSSGDYLVSSLEYGPFPSNNGQIEAFSIAFNTTLKLYPKATFENAIYIEEYSFVLPCGGDATQISNDVVYGKWLTGGIAISARSFGRIAQVMSWIPRGNLQKSFELAGFELPEEPSLENATEDKLGLLKTAKETSDLNEASSSGFSEDFSLIGRPELEQFFKDNIIDIVLHQEQYKRMGIPFPGATILYGPPGCGKTYAVEKLSEYLGWQRFDIDSSTIASSLIHDTSKKISEVFDAAIKAAPSILVIDEMEAFLSNRNMSISTSTHHVEEVAEFLRRIPEAISKGVLVFAMTNMLDSIDPAILRRGRFDHIIEVKMASKEEIAAFLHAKFRDLPIADNVNIDGIASKLDNHPMSDITFVLREAGRMAVKNGLEFMNQSCFDAAIHTLPKKEEKRTIGFTP